LLRYSVLIPFVMIVGITADAFSYILFNILVMNSSVFVILLVPFITTLLMPIAVLLACIDSDVILGKINPDYIPIYWSVTAYGFLTFVALGIFNTISLIPIPYLFKQPVGAVVLSFGVPILIALTLIGLAGLITLIKLGDTILRGMHYSVSDWRMEAEGWLFASAVLTAIVSAIVFIIIVVLVRQWNLITITSVLSEPIAVNFMMFLGALTYATKAYW
jgi:hypothetical protein